jgi:hypothetical protein
MSATTTLKLKLIQETSQARLYEKEMPSRLPGIRQWVPRSVCPRTLKAGDNHEVDIEDWWLEQNPFTKKDGKQKELL